MREILERVERHQSVRLTLPGSGVLSIDRGAPYLLVHRHPPAGEDAGTSRLLAGEASYLISGRGPDAAPASLIRRLARAGAETYGAYLVLEVWAARQPESARFVVRGPAGPAPEALATLAEGLRSLRDLDPRLEVEVEETDERHPPDLPPLLSVRESWEAGVLLLGLEIPPIYRDAETGRVYPRFLRRLQGRLSEVLRKTLYEFLRVQTTCELESHHALGVRSIPEVVRELDRELVAIEHAFDFLLLTSPVNEEQAWEQFRADDFRRNPSFHYRLLPVDPDLLKRRLFALALEEIDDPALAYLYQDKREELDRQLSMLGERGTPAFRFGSMRLYGTVDDRLRGMAEDLLSSVAPPAPGGGEGAEWVEAPAFRDAAAAELAHYAAAHPAAATRSIQLRPDVVGLMVSEGNLLIGAGLRLRPARVEALLQHEVGTHVLTYVNGSLQPLEQLSLGLADYDELQEGLAVLAEYLVGGLDPFRMRLLAARVVAAHSVEHGAEFVETFRLLVTGHGFPPRSAWHVAARVHECGGFTRDLIYLRGLVRLLDHLEGGGRLEPLYLGKIAQKHVPIMEELRHRGVVRDPPLLPRFLSRPDVRARLEAVHRGITLTEMICPETG